MRASEGRDSDAQIESFAKPALFFAGRKGGHKGRARQYTSPEEIDAQLQAEKQKAKVSPLQDLAYPFS